MGMWDKPELLERLVVLVGCDFLSDLRQSAMLAQVRLAADRIPAEAYSLHEWTAAVQYILRVEQTFDSVEQAKDFLIQGAK